ncbi:hypothetical protein ACFLV0_07445, partial [Chloroflexota bacterium]
MDNVNVLIVSGTDLQPNYLEKIRAVDPRFSIKIGIKQLIKELREKDGKAALANRLEDETKLWADLLPAEEQENLDSLLAHANVVFGRVALPSNLLSRAPELKWIHIQGAGLDAY